MPKHLLVDGFNVIRRDRVLSAAERRNFYLAQDRLVSRLAAYRRDTPHRVTVVFDGHASGNWFRSRARRHGVDIIYSSHGETADDVIRETVERADSAQALLVATADRALARDCRGRGVNVVLPEELTRRSRPETFRPPAAEDRYEKNEETGWSGHTRKRGNPRRAPKHKRRARGLW